MGIFGTLGGIASTVMNVGKIVLPILNAFRAASPEVDAALDKVDDVIEQGGEIADDFFDRNLSTLEQMNEFFVDLGAVAGTGQDLTRFLIDASQNESPETITPEEAQRAGLLIIQLKQRVVDLATTEELAEKIAMMK